MRSCLCISHDMADFKDPLKFSTFFFLSAEALCGEELWDGDA